MQATALRQLDEHEIDSVSGGNPLTAIGAPALLGAIGGGLAYSYESAISGAGFDWSVFSGAVLQGAISGAIAGAGALAFTLPGGFVAGVTAEGTVAIINMTDPYLSLD
jgi:hypothetical protein